MTGGTQGLELLQALGNQCCDGAGAAGRFH
jgi:hypothetical protein